MYTRYFILTKEQLFKVCYDNTVNCYALYRGVNTVTQFQACVKNKNNTVNKVIEKIVNQIDIRRVKLTQFNTVGNKRQTYPLLSN
jgi:hypothetical protein